MRCQSCGREIADKAIVCYRCGAPTAIPARPPAAEPPGAARRGPPWALLVSLVFALGIVALYWRDSTPAEYAALAGAWAVALAGLWFLRRPRPPV